MKTSDFYYDLPEELIAQHPVEPRDASRLLVYDRKTETITHKHFYDLPEYLGENDVLVRNNTKVIPARIYGISDETGAKVEFLLYKRLDLNEWKTLCKPAKKAKIGYRFTFGDALACTVTGAGEMGERTVRFEYEGAFEARLSEVGQTPLPPYIHEKLKDGSRYQTVYAKYDGSCAAPTAGLHFTPELIERIKAKGVDWETVHLEVGLDTFRIVDEEFPKDHQIHTERYTVPEKTVEAIKRTKANGGRVIAIGTTSVRSLESAWDAEAGEVLPRDREATSLFILPGYEFHVVDAMVTNFHVPRSTLMMLVSAFSSRDNIMKAYRHAIKHKYRMLSFGDAMFIE